MSTTLFPAAAQTQTQSAQTLPLCREVLWDFTANAPVFRQGRPVIAEGLAAVITWAWLALHTPRYRHEIFTPSYGSELTNLLGQPYSEELKRSEAARYVRECLEINPYITSVDDITVSFENGVLSVSAVLKTIYGEGVLSI